MCYSQGTQAHCIERQEDKSQFWQPGLFEPGWQEIVMLFYNTSMEGYGRDPVFYWEPLVFSFPTLTMLKDTGKQQMDTSNK